MTSTAGLLGTLLGPPDRVRVATRAALTLLIAMLVLRWTGHLELTVYASFGAFAAVHGGPPAPTRWWLQAESGVVLVVATLLGCTLAALHAPQPWVIAVTALVATATARLSDLRGWRPSGPIFAVMAVSTSAWIPVDGAGLLRAVVAATTTATLAVALGHLEPPAGNGPGPHRPGPIDHPRHRQLLHAARCGIAVVIAGALAQILDIDRGYWAMISAVVPLTTIGLRHQLTRGAYRLVGTSVGVLVAGAVLHAHLSALAMIMLIAALQGVIELWVIRHYAVALVFITVLVLVSGQLAHPHDIGSLIRDRLLETLLGVAVGTATAWLTRQRTPA